LKGADIVRLPVDGGAPLRLFTIKGIIKLVAFNRDVPDQLLILTEGPSSKPGVGWLSVKTGKVIPIQFDPTSSEDQRMVEHLRGWDRVYGDTSVYAHKLTKASFSGSVERTDVFLKTRKGDAINVSRCEDANCGQPSLSADGRRVVFIKFEEE
jgi:hypothetical protein